MAVETSSARTLTSERQIACIWSWPEDLPTLRERFLNAKPYPHIVLDRVFAPGPLTEIYDEVPDSGSDRWIKWGSGWKEFSDSRNQKRGISSLFLLGERTARFLQQLNSEEFLSDVRILTGMPALLGDNLFNGGGLQCTGRGGRLRVHVDKVRHPRADKFDQAVNLILFLNPVWQTEYGGHLELWSQDASCRCISISPLFNRLVLFRSDRQTFHGHPEPVQCPEGTYRTSLAVYYYVPRKLQPRPNTTNEIGWRD